MVVLQLMNGRVRSNVRRMAVVKLMMMMMSMVIEIVCWRSIHKLLLEFVRLTGSSCLLQLVNGVELMTNGSCVHEFTILGWSKVLIDNIVGGVAWWTN